MSEINMDQMRYGFGDRLDRFEMQIMFSKQYSKKYILECAIGAVIGIASHEGMDKEALAKAVSLYKGEVPLGDS